MAVEAGDGGCFGGFGSWRFAGEMELGLHLREGEGDGLRVAELSEGVDPRASGIAEAEEFGDFVVGFAGGVVEGAADEGVVPGFGDGAGEVEVGVAAGDDEGQGWFGCGMRRFVLSHPFRLRTRKGWGTRQTEKRALRLRCAALRMTLDLVGLALVE
jgi:hypothetical protein